MGRRTILAGIIFALLPSAANADITANLVGWWRLDDGTGTKASDLSGSGKDGTLENGADSGWTPGQINRAISFDGNNDQVSLPTSLGINGQSAITIAAWVKPASPLVDFSMVFSQRLTNDNNRIELLLSGASAGGNNNIQALVCNGNTPMEIYTTGNIISPGVWHHWCMVFDGTEIDGTPEGNADDRLEIYVDGVLQTVTTPGASTIPTTTPNISTASYIGRHGSDGSFPFKGVIDDVRLYNRALTPVDVMELYHWRGLDGIVDNQYFIGNNSVPTTPAPLSQRVLGVGKPQLIGIGIVNSKITPSGMSAEQGSIQNVAKEMGGAGEVITTTTGNHSVYNYDYVKISGVLGYTAVNDYNGNKGNWVAKRESATTFRLLGSAATSGTFMTGGTPLWTKASRFVTVEGYPSATPETDDRLARIQGIDIDGGYTGVGGGSSLTVAPVADGIHLDGQLAQIQNVRVRRFKGVCATSRYHLAVRDSYLFDSFTGIQLRTSDCFAHGNTVAGMRDHGLHVMPESGNCYTRGNHFYGVNNNDGTMGAGTRGEAALIQGQGYRSMGDIFADAYDGLVVDAPSAQISGCYFQHNKHQDARFVGRGNELLGCVVFCMRSTTPYPNKVGIVFEEERCAMLDGTLELTSYDEVSLLPSSVATGALIKGNLCTIRTRLIDDDGYNGTTGIEISGSRNGTRIDCRVYGFGGTSDRILKATATPACQDIHAEFHGDFTDLTNPGDETAGVKKYIDISAGWTGSIKLVKISDGTSVTLHPGIAY